MGSTKAMEWRRVWGGYEAALEGNRVGVRRCFEKA